MGMNHRAAVLTIIILAFAALAFGQGTLRGKTWQAIYLSGAIPPTSSVFLHISSNSFTGNTGCNIMNGKVNIRGQSISFSAIITTKRACTQSSASLESSILSALTSTTRYKVVSPGRAKFFAGKRLVAEFQSRSTKSDADEPQNPVDQLGIEDRKWMLASIGPNAISKTENPPYIIFDPAKGSAGGDTGCNAFGGTYNVTNGSKISITEIISTMRACIENERMDLERGFLDGLRAADRFVIQADKMSLYQRNELLLTFVGRKK